jgi:hypothetical protein
MASSSTAPSFSDIELASLLVAQLGLEDIEDIHGLAAEASFLDDEAFSNEEYALRLQAQYLQNMLQIDEDHKLALSLDEGLEANHPAFRNVLPNPPTPIQPADVVPLFVEDSEDELDGELEYIDQEVPAPLYVSIVYPLGNSSN